MFQPQVENVMIWLLRCNTRYILSEFGQIQVDIACQSFLRLGIANTLWLRCYAIVKMWMNLYQILEYSKDVACRRRGEDHSKNTVFQQKLAKVRFSRKRWLNKKCRLLLHLPLYALRHSVPELDNIWTKRILCCSEPIRALHGVFRTWIWPYSGKTSYGWNVVRNV